MEAARAACGQISSGRTVSGLNGDMGIGKAAIQRCMITRGMAREDGSLRVLAAGDVHVTRIEPLSI